MASVWWFKLEPGPPTVTFTSDAALFGRTAAGEVTVTAAGRPPLRWVEIRLTANGQTVPLAREEFPADTAPRQATVKFNADLTSSNLTEGPATLEVAADTYAWHLFGGARGNAVSRAVAIDTTPPRIDLLTTQHNLRLGGAGLALMRVSPDATAVEVVVDHYVFPAVRGYFADPDATLVLFAVPQDLSVAAQPLARASDAAGNTTEVALPVTIKDRKFPERQMALDDAFLQRKVPEILAKVGKPVPTNLLEGYLTVNRDVRRESEEKLDAVTARSANEPLWTGPFHRQSNAAPMSAFADRRVYMYQGQAVDRQTHLGYDLASLKRAPVEAAQAGVVVFAGYLGIYGDAVVIDHGFGVATVYGHLSSLAVKEGQHVQEGETIGQTGETGLAGGDHLHFSVMLRGTHVDPVEWWDPHWLRDQVTSKLATLPAAKPAAAVAAESAPAAPQPTAHAQAAP
ncbi:MAG: M23 family metallopeptidase [Deltaproteobacteria bacterium]|nr:M23 family metallopeptidase [Deltaproteobacteria bacterium]